MTKKTVTGALGLITGRMKKRAENQDKNTGAEGDDEEDINAETVDDDPAAEDENEDIAAEDDDDDMDAEGDDEDDVAEDDDKNVNAKSPDYKAGMRAGTTRIHKILSHPAGAKVPSLATALAFDKAYAGLSTNQAIGMLKAGAEDAPERKTSGSLAARMQQHKTGIAPNKPKTTGAEAKGDDSLLASAAKFTRRQAQK